MQAGVAKGVGLVYYVLHRELVANPVYGLWAEVQENRQPEVRLLIRSFQEGRRHLSWICVDYSDPVLKLWERVILPRFFFTRSRESTPQISLKTKRPTVLDL